jgi:hypothetical protein
LRDEAWRDLLTDRDSWPDVDQIGARLDVQHLQSDFLLNCRHNRRGQKPRGQRARAHHQLLLLGGGEFVGGCVE